MAISKSIFVGLIFLVSLIASLSSAISDDAPFVVAHKKVSLNRLKSGSEHVSVSIDIYNQGSAWVAIGPDSKRLYVGYDRDPEEKLGLDLLTDLGFLCSPTKIRQQWLIPHGTRDRSIKGQVKWSKLKKPAGDVPIVVIKFGLQDRGCMTAYDVSISDDSWVQDIFSLVSGNISITWERLDAGALVSNSFVLESKVKGIFYGAPAVIKFRIPTKAALQEAYSTPILPLDILADRLPEKKFEWAKRLLAKYGSQVSVISIVALFMYLVATPSKSSAAKGGKKRR